MDLDAKLDVTNKSVDELKCEYDSLKVNVKRLKEGIA